jgi:hypothetical protein
VYVRSFVRLDTTHDGGNTPERNDTEHVRVDCPGELARTSTRDTGAPRATSTDVNEPQLTVNTRFPGTTDGDTPANDATVNGRTTADSVQSPWPGTVPTMRARTRTWVSRPQPPKPAPAS